MVEEYFEKNKKRICDYAIKEWFDNGMTDTVQEKIDDIAEQTLVKRFKTI